MRYLVDTNVLLRSVEEAHPMNDAAVNAIEVLLTQGKELCITLQNLIEFWAVATRPVGVNGLGLSLSQAIAELTELKGIFTLQPDTPRLMVEWERLVVQHQVMGKQAHDTRLVAAMLTHQITHLLTFNTDDFKRFAEITAIDPREVLMQGAIEED
ncbi:type II toxin-antitoxin system VapC family toxin [Egbenema bharatensis]|uniref:type II toxin-antitoxin system VapC family toxin n=1 Tax=Egbenema bharatensis TaxID=3463334 RepID=UPI003A8656AB